MYARPRRLRRTQIIRNLVSETKLDKDMFIYPYFVIPGKHFKEPIESMPGISHFSLDELLKDIEVGLKFGVNKILLFGVGNEKTEDASSAYAEKSIVVETLKELNDKFGDNLFVVTDVCICAYTTHGHCGLLKEGSVDNDSSLQVISQMALAHAEAGASMVAPSDMMDGRVGAIRETLDKNNLTETGIMSYSVKYASSYYGPFREAADSSPGKGDRKSYQMDFRNSREALREAELDEEEGADILMVKPALAYLDIIKEIKQISTLPVACYNVSGEYSMVKAAASAGFVDEKEIVMENMYAFSRAGADIIISYHTRDILEKGWL
ncbi:MAG: porphobilinogen synthase [Bacteroidetes bacterium]|nr:MAG: porphobilinogen synthase [Bacteroidota bacterium]